MNMVNNPLMVRFAPHRRNERSQTLRRFAERPSGPISPRFPVLDPIAVAQSDRSIDLVENVAADLPLSLRSPS
jgi:hypothetical protein